MNNSKLGKIVTFISDDLGADPDQNMDLVIRLMSVGGGEVKATVKRGRPATSGKNTINYMGRKIQVLGVGQADPNNPALGNLGVVMDYLYDLRHDKGLKYNEMSERLGVSRTTIQKFFKNGVLSFLMAKQVYDLIVKEL